MKRIIAMLLTVLMLIPTLVACANNQTDVPGSSSGSESSSEGDAPKSQYIDTGLPTIDFEGKSLRYYSRGTTADSAQDSSAPDIVSDGLNSDPLNNAVFQRNELLSALYNVKFVNYQFDEPAQSCRTAIQSDMDPCDILTDDIEQLATCVTNYQLYDMKAVSKYTDYNASWWDQRCYNQTSILNMVFFMSGSITIMDNKATWAMAFNKDLITDLNLESPYDLVNSKQWTYDAMYKMMQAATKDLNGDDVIDTSDQWGLLTETFNTYALFAGSGAYIINKDENDLPRYAMNDNERNYDALLKAVTINTDRNYMLTGSGNLHATEDQSIKIFYEGRALFWIGSMGILEWMRPYETDFGILPLPMLDENQDNYYSVITPSHYCAYSIPASLSSKDLDFVDLMLENLAIYSQKLVEPVYIDQILVGKGMRDVESEPMLDIIFNNVLYDLGAIYKFGNAYGLAGSVTVKKFSGLTSQLKKAEGTVKSDINKLVDALKKRYQ